MLIFWKPAHAFFLIHSFSLSLHHFLLLPHSYWPRSSWNLESTFASCVRAYLLAFSLSLRHLLLDLGKCDIVSLARVWWRLVWIWRLRHTLSLVLARGHPLRCRVMHELSEVHDWQLNIFTYIYLHHLSGHKLSIYIRWKIYIYINIHKYILQI